jgi:hypothetical protein
VLEEMQAVLDGWGVRRRLGAADIDEQ